MTITKVTQTEYVYNSGLNRTKTLYVVARDFWLKMLAAQESDNKQCPDCGGHECATTRKTFAHPHTVSRLLGCVNCNVELWRIKGDGNEKYVYLSNNPKLASGNISRYWTFNQAIIHGIRI